MKTKTIHNYCASLFIAPLVAIIVSGCHATATNGTIDEVEMSEPPTQAAAAGDPHARIVYVPAYSHLPQSTKPNENPLSVLLSVRNVDSTAVVTLTHVDYFDTSGHRVRRYLKKPRALRPLETAEFSVDASDDAGGSGANFLVYWDGPSDAHSLLTETVMWGFLGRGYVSFTSRGVELDRRPDPEAFMKPDPSSASAKANCDTPTSTDSSD